jgi:hypothetical protein
MARSSRVPDYDRQCHVVKLGGISDELSDLRQNCCTHSFRRKSHPLADGC